jgi:hypothetical protein
MNSFAAPPSPRALIIIPGTVNYFYNLSGRRIAAALVELGFDVDVSTLPNCPARGYEFGLISNIGEVLHTFGQGDEGIRQIAAIRERCAVMASLAIDCAQTHWYRLIRDRSADAGIGLIFDLGLHDQSEFLAPADRINYRFVFSGLTAAEVSTINLLDGDDRARTIPWAFVGHVTPHRSALVDYLVRAVDPGGFVYMPSPAPYTERGSPHLNQEQFDRVLAKTQYQVWCSHHWHFYMEPERFRSSLLTGGVPIKIVESREQIPKSAPLGYLMMEAALIGGRLNARVFPRLRRRFRDDWLAFPTLASELARALRAAGIATGSSESRAA